MEFTLVPPINQNELSEWMKFNQGVKIKEGNLRDFAKISYFSIPGVKEYNFSYERIIKLICIQLNIKRDDVVGRSRLRQFAEARLLFWYIYREFNKNVTLKQLGDFFGRDHTTALHGVRLAESLLKTDKYFRAKYQRIKDELQNN